MIVAQSERLYFKQFCPKDAEGFYQLNAIIENIRYTGDKPFASREQTLAFINNYDHYRLHGFGRWSVYFKQNNQYVGFCGLRYDEHTKQVDVGYRIAQQFWRQGLAYEAAQCALKLGFARFDLDTIVAKAREDNPASIRVLVKCGFEKTGELFEDNEKWHTFALSKSHYLLLNK